MKSLHHCFHMTPLFFEYFKIKLKFVILVEFVDCLKGLIKTYE